MIVRWLKGRADLLFGQERVINARKWIDRNRKKAHLLRQGLRFHPILPYLDIDGWLSHNEAMTLYELARSLPAPAPVLVEIGSWLGKSSVVLAKGIQSYKMSVLYCIDPFDGAGDPVSLTAYSRRKAALQTSLREQFEQNIRKNHVDQIIKVCQGYSHDYVAGFEDQIDLLFIDGNHEYQYVMQDYQDWSPLIKAGGLIAFHDVVCKESVQGPQKVIDEKLKNNSQWKRICWIDSLYVAQKLG
jgi:predicted O-methyltransferase YrrM